MTTTDRTEAERLALQLQKWGTLYGVARADALDPAAALLRAQAAEIDRLRNDCGEAYQVVGAGMLGEPCPYTQTDVERALDNLSAAANGIPRPHDDLLPWPPYPTPPTEPTYPHPKCDAACHYVCTEAGAHPPSCATEPAAAPAGQPEAITAERWQKVGDVIEEALAHYRCHHIADENGEPLPLTDALTLEGSTSIATGEAELEYLTSHILLALHAATPQPAETAAAPQPTLSMSMFASSADYLAAIAASQATEQPPLALDVNDIDEMADRYGDFDEKSDCYSFNRLGRNSVRALVAEALRRARQRKGD